MAASVRFTKPEREYLRSMLEGRITTEKLGVLRDSILDKLEKSELVKGKGKDRAPGIGWVAAVDAMKEAVGDRLAVPPKPDVGWIVRMSNRIRELGLTPDDCRDIANYLARRGMASVSFEYAIKFADSHLADARRVAAKGTAAPQKAPIEMGGR